MLPACWSLHAASIWLMSLFLSVMLCLFGIYLQACKGIYMKRENDDLQKAEKLVLFLGFYSLVMIMLQKTAPKVLEGRGFFYGMINIAVVVLLCGMLYVSS